MSAQEEALTLDLHPTRPEQSDVWSELVRSFAEEKATIDADAPGTSNRAFRAARKKIEAGHFQHASDARSAAPLLRPGTPERR